MQLSRDNYHSLKAEQDYMSRSQYLGFLACEAQQVAKQAGEWAEEPSDALLVGSYVHAWNECRRREFICEHPEMFTQKGELKANFKLADKMIVTLEADPLVMYMLKGEKEVIFTAEFAGTIWKVMVDVYTPEHRRLIDLKTTKSIREKAWSQAHNSRVSFIEQYNYILQAALYSEVERLASGRSRDDWFDFYAVAVSKETVPDKEIIDMRDQNRYLIELAQVETNMPRILKVKSGQVEPVRCERCDYCKSTRKIVRPVHYKEI